LVTRALKSTLTSAMRPETWLPIATVTRGDTVPVAVTLAWIAPRVTAAVL
jgi:hypothetical protein